VTDDPRLAAEQRARLLIDQQLADAGWLVQDRKHINLFAGLGIAVREVIMAKGHGRVDYLLYVDKRVVGVIEAKPVGTTLSGVEWQSAMYAEGLPPEVRLKALTVDGRLPFIFEASGTETHFTNGYDPQPRARRLFNIPKPETLARILRDAERDPARPTWRAKVRALPALDERPMRKAQAAASIDPSDKTVTQNRQEATRVTLKHCRSRPRSTLPSVWVAVMSTRANTGPDQIIRIA
jgi:type I restriction enzyme R subunit